MATIIESDWESGDGILDSLWEGETDTNSRLSENTSSLMWGAHCLYWSGSTSSVGNVYKTFTATGTFGLRFGLHLVAESLANGNIQRIVNLMNAGGPTSIVYANIVDVSGSIYLRVTCLDAGSTARTVGDVLISTGTNYQVVIKFDAALASGCSFTVYAEDGTTVIDEEKVLGYTTYNTDLVELRAGATGATTYTLTHGIDIVLLTDQYAYPATVTAEAPAVQPPILLRYEVY